MGIRAFCVHGHFYQPPREDPLSGIIPDEEGSQPFANWNEKILAECYRPNALEGNFERISFNVGPTLFRWMEKADPATYQMIIDQEKKNHQKHGVGNGMAQSYNHSILPLASKRDKKTQIMWGLADFELRFGHRPAGMWLPEAAVDLETLSVMAECGLQFTILAPWQADEPVNTGEPYFVQLPGRNDPFIVFFYDQELSTRISFDPESTVNASVFAEYVLENSFSDHSENQLVIAASDGELYGHHQSYREKFLAYLMNGVLKVHQIEMTYPGLWLKKHMPQKFVKINEYSSWSCHHGIVRWMGECECSPGAVWKASMRWGLDKLADDIDQVYESYLGQFTPHMWQLRDDYIHVLLGEQSISSLLGDYVKNSISSQEKSNISLLLAAQYERQRMYTSCGWFFDHFHRIEPQNNIAYAAQAVWLLRKATGVDLIPKALALLKKVKSQRTGLRGDTVFAEKILRASDFSEEEEVTYFNPSSSFSI